MAGSRNWLKDGRQGTWGGGSGVAGWVVRLNHGRII